jgi:outer membrane cobalamin receptor
VRLKFQTDTTGTAMLPDVPQGRYLLEVGSEGFTPQSREIDVSPAGTTEEHLQLQLAGVKTQVDVAGRAILLPQDPGNSQYLGKGVIDARPGGEVSRQLDELVARQPGWLMEANGVLHPRGSEYDTQLVVDGLPLYENRSSSFAPVLDVNEVQQLVTQTGGYPASFGRKLGGVVEVTTAPDPAQGWHGSMEAEAASFAASEAAVQSGYTRGAATLRFAVSGLHSDRYLDPPTFENFHNSGGSGTALLGFSTTIKDRTRVRVQYERGASAFDVPNELEQENAGQRQSRDARDQRGQFYLQQVLTTHAVLDVRGMIDAFGAGLDSNNLATPIIASQDRSGRQAYLSAILSQQWKNHTFQVGADALGTVLDERFAYQITDPSAFGDGVQPGFDFHDRRHGVENAAFVQDRYAHGPFTANLGIRWDRYDVLVHEAAWSPRLAASYLVKPLHIVLSASYDRIFNTPAIENLLLASSPATLGVTPDAAGLAVKPARANFWEVGASTVLFGSARLEARAFRRDFRDFSDDDLFLNTAVSFPLAFSSALIEGIEATFAIPEWKRVSAGLNYSNLSGRARLPLTGGLLLDDSDELLNSRDFVRVSQDQRNTASGWLQYRASKRIWFGATGTYNSGLPIEVENDSVSTEDPRLLSKVNLERGRVRPSAAVGLEAGATLLRRERKELQLQASVANLFNRDNVINFAGLFSGTAVAPPRTLGGRVRYRF